MNNNDKESNDYTDTKTDQFRTDDRNTSNDNFRSDSSNESPRNQSFDRNEVRNNFETNVTHSDSNVDNGGNTSRYNSGFAPRNTTNNMNSREGDNRTGASRGRFGRSSGDSGYSSRPSFGGNTSGDRRPSFGGDRRPSSFGGGDRGRPSFGGPSRYSAGRPSFGGNTGGRPSFGGDRRGGSTFNNDVIVKLFCEEGCKIAKATNDSAAYDLHSAETVEMKPMAIVRIRTGIFLNMTFKSVLLICSRSGLATEGIVVLNAPGIVDADYEKEVSVILANFSDVSVTINKGDRIAQALFIRTSNIKLEFVNSRDELSSSSSRDGFGSTGR